MVSIGTRISLLTQNRLIHMIDTGKIICPNGTIVGIGLDISLRRISPCQSDGIGGIQIIGAYPDFRYSFGIPILNFIR